MAESGRIEGAEYHTVPSDQVNDLQNQALERRIAATVINPDEDAEGNPKPGYTTVVFLPPIPKLVPKEGRPVGPGQD